MGQRPFWSCWNEILSAYPFSHPISWLQTKTSPKHVYAHSQTSLKNHTRKGQLKTLKIPFHTLFIWWVFKCKPLSQQFHRDTSVGRDDNEPSDIPLRAETPVYLHLSLHTHLPPKVRVPVSASVVWERLIGSCFPSLFKLLGRMVPAKNKVPFSFGQNN